MDEIIEFLSELSSNCGDNRGRDGEFLSDQVQIILEKIQNTDYQNILISMKTIQELVNAGLCENFYLTDKGEKLPYTPKNQQIFETGLVKWSSVSKKKEIDKD